MGRNDYEYQAFWAGFKAGKKQAMRSSKSAKNHRKVADALEDAARDALEPIDATFACDKIVIWAEADMNLYDVVSEFYSEFDGCYTLADALEKIANGEITRDDVIDKAIELLDFNAQISSDGVGGLVPSGPYAEDIGFGYDDYNIKGWHKA